VVSNPTQGMDVCVHLFCVCVVLSLGRGLATSWSPVQGVLPSVKWSWNWENVPYAPKWKREEEEKEIRTENRSAWKIVPWKYSILEWKFQYLHLWRNSRDCFCRNRETLHIGVKGGGISFSN
jgi:hypothetical protein